MKYFFFLLTILFVGSSFQSNNQSRNFDFYFIEDDAMMTEKSLEKLSEVSKYIQQFENVNIGIEVPSSNNETLNRERLDELLFELESLELSVERILFYSSDEQLSDDLKKLASRGGIRLTVKELINNNLSNSKPTTNQNNNILASKKVNEITIPKSNQPIIDYQNNVKKFTISNDVSYRLKTNDGSFIKIQPESFVFEDGTLVDTLITIETKYADSKNIAILDELTTTFNGEILESRGMMYVNATANGQQLKLAEGKSLEINVKTEKIEQGFQAFQGVRNTSDWLMVWLANERVRLKAPFRGHKFYKYEKISAEKQAEFIEFREEQIQVWEEKGYTKKQIKKKLKSAEKYSRRREKQKKAYYKKKREYRLKDGVIKRNYSDRKKWGYNLIRKSVKSNPNRYPKRYKIGIPRYEFIEYKNTVKKEKKVVYYAMQSMSLGWCNIDRLLKMNKDKPPCDLIVQAGQDENVKIIFDRYFVVLKGQPHKNGFIFKNIPQGLGITVLSATKLENGNIKFSNTKTKIDNKKVRLPDYNTVSSSEFIQFVESLTV